MSSYRRRPGRREGGMAIIRGGEVQLTPLRPPVKPVRDAVWRHAAPASAVPHPPLAHPFPSSSCLRYLFTNSYHEKSGWVVQHRGAARAMRMKE